MAAPHPDVIIRGTGKLFDGSMTVCPVNYTLYQNLRDEKSAPFQGSIMIENGERKRSDILNAIKNGRVFSLSLEKPLSNGETLIKVSVARAIGNPVDGLYEVTIAPVP